MNVTLQSPIRGLSTWTKTSLVEPRRRCRSGSATSSDVCRRARGPETGRRFILDGGEIIIGRSSDATIQVDRDSVSRRHARLSKTEGGWTVQDLQSTNGNYVNDVPIREHKLASGDLLKVGSDLRYLAGNNLESLLTDELYQIAVRDGLTHSLSRRAFVETADREVARALAVTAFVPARD